MKIILDEKNIKNNVSVDDPGNTIYSDINSVPTSLDENFHKQQHFVIPIYDSRQETYTNNPVEEENFYEEINLSLTHLQNFDKKTQIKKKPMPLPPETQCSGLNIEEDSETNYENTNHTKNEACLYQNMKKNEDNAIRKKPIPLPRISYSLDEINIETYNKVMMNDDVEEESIEINEEEIYNIFPNSTKNTLEKELSTSVAAKRKIDFNKPGQEVELRRTGSLRTKTLKKEQRNLSKSIQNIEMLNKAKLVNYIRRLSVTDLIESYESLDGIEQERVREEFQEAKLERLKEECLNALNSISHIQTMNNTSIIDKNKDDNEKEYRKSFINYLKY